MADATSWRHVVLAGLLAGLVRASDAGAVCDPPRCIDVVEPLPHRIAVPENTVRVLLPADWVLPQIMSIVGAPR